MKEPTVLNKYIILNKISEKILNIQKNEKLLYLLMKLYKIKQNKKSNKVSIEVIDFNDKNIDIEFLSNEDIEILKNIQQTNNKEFKIFMLSLKDKIMKNLLLYLTLNNSYSIMTEILKKDISILLILPLEKLSLNALLITYVLIFENKNIKENYKYIIENITSLILKDLSINKKIDIALYDYLFVFCISNNLKFRDYINLFENGKNYFVYENINFSIKPLKEENITNIKIISHILDNEFKTYNIEEQLNILDYINLRTVTSTSMITRKLNEKLILKYTNDLSQKLTYKNLIEYYGNKYNNLFLFPKFSNSVTKQKDFFETKNYSNLMDNKEKYIDNNTTGYKIFDLLSTHFKSTKLDFKLETIITKKGIDVFTLNQSNISKEEISEFIDSKLSSITYFSNFQKYLLYYVLYKIESFSEIKKYKNIMKSIVLILKQQLENYIEQRLTYYSINDNPIDLIVFIANKFLENNYKFHKKEDNLNILKDFIIENYNKSSNSLDMLGMLSILFSYEEYEEKLYPLFDFKTFLNIFKSKNEDYFLEVYRDYQKLLDTKYNIIILRYIIDNNLIDYFVENITLFNSKIFKQIDLNKFNKFILNNISKIENISKENADIQMILYKNNIITQSQIIEYFYLSIKKHEQHPYVIKNFTKTLLENLHENIKKDILEDIFMKNKNSFLDNNNISLYLKIKILLIILQNIHIYINIDNNKNNTLITNYINTFIDYILSNEFLILSSKNIIELLVSEDYSNLEHLNLKSLFSLIIDKSKSTEFINLILNLSTELNIQICALYKKEFYFMLTQDIIDIEEF